MTVEDEIRDVQQAFDRAELGEDTTSARTTGVRSCATSSGTGRPGEELAPVVRGSQVWVRQDGWRLVGIQFSPYTA
jgi:hypothetical protein